MGRFPSLMGRFPTLMGRFTDFVLRGRFTSWKSTGKQPIKKRGIKRFLRLPFQGIPLPNSFATSSGAVGFLGFASPVNSSMVPQLRKESKARKVAAWPFTKCLSVLPSFASKFALNFPGMFEMFPFLFLGRRRPLKFFSRISAILQCQIPTQIRSKVTKVCQRAGKVKGGWSRETD